LGVLHPDMEFRYKIERKIASHALKIEELRENQADEDKEGPSNLRRRKMRVADRAPDMLVSSRQVLLIPTARVVQDNDSNQCDQREPDDIALCPCANYERGQQWPQRLAGVAPNLKERLSKTVAAAGGESGQARRFWVKNGRTQSDRGGCHQDHRVAIRQSEQNQTYQGKSHPDCQRKWLRSMIGKQTYEGLQQRRGKLETQRNHPDLAKAELK